MLSSCAASKQGAVRYYLSLSLSLSLSLYLLLTQEWVPLALVDNVQEPHLIAAIFPGIQKWCSSGLLTNLQQKVFKVQTPSLLWLREIRKHHPLPFDNLEETSNFKPFLWGGGGRGGSRSIMTQLLMNLSWPLGTLMLAFPSWVGYCPSWEKRCPLIKSAMKWVGRWAGKYKRTIGGYKWTVIVHIGFPPVLGDYLVWWCRTRDSCSSYRKWNQNKVWFLEPVLESELKFICF